MTLKQVIGVFGLMVTLMAAQRSSAADYYFAANGNDGNPCTQGQPCKTLGRLNELVRSVRSGKYWLRGGNRFSNPGGDCIVAGVSGTANEPITVGSYGTGRAILEGCRNGVRGGTRHWIIDNLEIRNVGVAIRCYGCQDWKITNNLMHHTGSICVFFPRNSSRPPTRIRLSYNICRETGQDGGNGEGFYIWNGQDITIEHNEFAGLRDEGVNCKGTTRNLLIRNNYFHDFYVGPVVREPSALTRFAAWLLPTVHAGGNLSEDTGVNCRYAETSNVSVLDNIFERLPNTGVRMLGVQNAVTEGNEIRECAVGIHYGRGATGTIANNTLIDNDRPYLLQNTSVRPQGDIVR
jgi:parallel beta-helix repeat protein